MTEPEDALPSTVIDALLAQLTQRQTSVFPKKSLAKSLRGQIVKAAGGIQPGAIPRKTMQRQLKWEAVGLQKIVSIAPSSVSARGSARDGNDRRDSE